MGRALRLTGAATALAVALACAACEPPTERAAEPGDGQTGVKSGEQPGEGGTDDEGAPPSSPTTPPGGPEATVDPALAVPRPGPLTGAQHGDDLLIVGDTTLPAALVEEISSLQGEGGLAVEAVEQFSLGQVTYEGTVLNVAAVDAAGFRRFSGQQSASFQTQWNRVADGEVAVLESLKPQLPDSGYLPVDTAGGTRQIHVGAYAPTLVGTVDAVVNQAWGTELGLPTGNALVVSTGITSPQAVRTELERIIGTQTITDLDAVAESGIDLGALQTVQPVGTFADAVGVFRYTPIGGGRIAPDPAWVAAHIATQDVPILGSVTCNREMLPQLRAALAEVQRLGLADEINPDEYAGCYYPRFIAGSTTLSNHSFGLALDLNTPGNQRGTVGEMDRGVVAVFKRWGFAWGGDWNYTDPMHFELDRIVRPG